MPIQDRTFPITVIYPLRLFACAVLSPILLPPLVLPSSALIPLLDRHPIQSICGDDAGYVSWRGPGTWVRDTSAVASRHICKPQTWTYKFQYSNHILQPISFIATSFNFSAWLPLLSQMERHPSPELHHNGSHILVQAKARVHCVPHTTVGWRHHCRHSEADNRQFQAECAPATDRNENER